MASLLAYATAVARSPARTAAYYLRRALRWSRGVSDLRNESKDDLFDYLPASDRAAATARAAVLEEHYDLTEIRQRSTRTGYRENLALLDGLGRLVPRELLPDRPLRVLDIGCAEWLAVTALERFFAPAELLGVEVDGHVLYRDGHSRADHARARAEQTGSPGVEYRVADFLRTDPGPRDVVTLFYPFVTIYPLLAWGLPITHFRPRRLLEKAVECLVPGGLLIVCNQTDDEQQRLFELLDDEPVQCVAHADLATDLVDYAESTEHRCGAVFRKCGSASFHAEELAARSACDPIQKD